MIKIVPTPEMMKLIEGKQMEIFKQESASKLSKVSAEDIFVSSGKMEQNMKDFLTTQELEDIKKLSQDDVKKNGKQVGTQNKNYFDLANSMMFSDEDKE